MAASLRLSNVICKCQELPGQELFQYIDQEGERRTIGSADVNAYPKEITGADFTAKDFRTWAGTVLAAGALRELGTGETESQAKKNIVRAVGEVAQRLGNTPAICRKCYIHPAILEAYLDGVLVEVLKRRPPSCASGLAPEEHMALRLLKRKL